MAILLSNDDGIDAPGLAALEEALAGLDDLFVSAPDENRSGVGMGITLGRDLKVRRHPDGPAGAERHSISGTPADAVKYGLQHVLGGKPPRLVVSGINLGPNLGVNVRCSGTVGAAFEAVAAGIPAVAASVEWVKPPVWEGAKHYVRQIVEKALAMAESGRHAPFLLNLNVPAKPPEEIRGVVLAPHGVGGIADILIPNAAGNAFSLKGKWIDLAPGGVCDTRMLMAGHAVVTPMRFDMTDRDLLGRLRDDWGCDDVKVC